MKLSAIFLLTAPLLVSADWTYKKGGKVNKGNGNTKCNADKLNQGTDWSWDNRSPGCKLYMYGDVKCTGQQGLNFQTRGDHDLGNARTDHLAWQL
ncbi:hypothetical protein FKW77_008450 [Venturia effusa]|uniref:Uncharacterized protein n=1 Tax=Venturia effusa TaxID=50376 RepID=A0A517LCS5_9PEZI|nr:hypothetical protein FKW77_008450 [Venturia effusa]